MQYLTRLIALVLSVMFAVSVNASVINIVGYDIEGLTPNGVNGFGFEYSGNVNNRVGVSGKEVSDLTGGTGTLTNGIAETSVNDIHLFNFGANQNPSITLYFDEFYSLSTLLFEGGGRTNFSIGQLKGLDVTAGQVTGSIQTTEQGDRSNGGVFLDDFYDFSGSEFTSVFIDQITLTNFIGFSSTETFAFSEIRLTGEKQNAVSVTGPSVFKIAILSALMFFFAKWRKKVKRSD